MHKKPFTACPLYIGTANPNVVDGKKQKDVEAGSEVFCINVDVAQPLRQRVFIVQTWSGLLRPVF